MILATPLSAQDTTSNSNVTDTIPFGEPGFKIEYDENYVESAYDDGHVVFASGAAQSHEDPIFGLKYRYYLFGVFSIDGEFMAGPDYLHVGAGMLGMGAWHIIKNSNNLSLPVYIILGSIALTALEHPTFHIPITPRTRLSPYASFLRLRWNDRNAKEFGEMNTGYAFGTELNVHISDRFIVAPYIEFSKSYDFSGSDLNVGLHVGYHFYD
jgi:hypothetical protein